MHDLGGPPGASQRARVRSRLELGIVAMGTRKGAGPRPGPGPERPARDECAHAAWPGFQGGGDYTPGQN